VDALCHPVITLRNFPPNSQVGFNLQIDGAGSMGGSGQTDAFGNKDVGFPYHTSDCGRDLAMSATAFGTDGIVYRYQGSSRCECPPTNTPTATPTETPTATATPTMPPTPRPPSVSAVLDANCHPRVSLRSFQPNSIIAVNVTIGLYSGSKAERTDASGNLDVVITTLTFPCGQDLHITAKGAGADYISYKYEGTVRCECPPTSTPTPSPTPTPLPRSFDIAVTSGCQLNVALENYPPDSYSEVTISVDGTKQWETKVRTDGNGNIEYTEPLLLPCGMNRLLNVNVKASDEARSFKELTYQCACPD
jgi:hypothetical protein